MNKYYWIDTEGNNGDNWILYERESVKASGDVEILRGEWPEDAHYGCALTPARQEEIWEEIDAQIESELGFIPDYDVN